MKLGPTVALFTAGVAGWSFALTSIQQETPLLAELRRRYTILVEHLNATQAVDPRFVPLRNVSIITGIDGRRMNRGTIGYNVNKGYEIYICLEGTDINSAMNILIHELAHVTVPEYDHTPAFWQNFKDLKELCKILGIYEPIVGEKEYCGIKIRD